MSSTQKTSFLNLNLWRGSDVPQMDDFIRDNVIIDNAVGLHTGNGNIHITAAERAKWNAPYYLFTYNGNGSASRSLSPECGFTPKWGIVYGVNKLSDLTDFSNGAEYNYFAVFSANGSMQGVSLSGGTLTVTQPPTPTGGTEYKNFNEVGVTYVCIMFA